MAKPRRRNTKGLYRHDRERIWKRKLGDGVDIEALLDNFDPELNWQAADAAIWDLARIKPHGLKEMSGYELRLLEEEFLEEQRRAREGPDPEDKNMSAATASRGGKRVGEESVEQKASEGTNAATPGKLIKRATVKKHTDRSGHVLLPVEYIGTDVDVYFAGAPAVTVGVTKQDVVAFTAMSKAIRDELVELTKEFFRPYVRAGAHDEFPFQKDPYGGMFTVGEQLGFFVNDCEESWDWTATECLVWNEEDMARFILGYRNEDAVQVHEGQPPVEDERTKHFSFGPD